jgi:hypothetical protein
VVVRAAAGDDDLPEEARDSIVLALTMYKEGKYEEALVEFERALTLPGTGQKQFKDKPALLSDGEKISALYNISCCHARLDSEYYALVRVCAPPPSRARPALAQTTHKHGRRRQATDRRGA